MLFQRRCSARCRSLLRSLALVVCLLPAVGLAQLVTLDHAQRVSATGSKDVTLPDTLTLVPGYAPPVRATYRMSVHVATVQRLAICMPGLIAHARIRFNGHVVDDRLDNPLAPLPRSVDRIRLIDVPAEFVHDGENILEIEAAGPRLISVSRVNVGTRASAAYRYERRILGAVIGPAFVAVAVGSLALCVLLLWARRGDSLYGYFGIGAFGWALHTAWSVLPERPLSGEHDVIWWTFLYTFFVAMLVIFCVRFAGWHWRRFEQALCVLSLSAPLILYAAAAAGVLEDVQEAWLLGWIAVVGVGVAAVGRYAWTHRNTDGALLLLTAVVSMAFALRDWFVNHGASENNPVFLVPYAGLLFVALVAWLLIDRFVATSRELETMNRELERRVTVKSAELVRALEQMSKAKESAEAANLSKSTFLAAASHDLRQPIHALGLYMSALADDHLNGGQQELMHRMETSLAALETMFNALLDVSRMDAGAVLPRPRPFALGPMLHRLAEEYAPLAAEKGLRLSVRIARAPSHVHASSDPMLVERIVSNLLSNAIKYTAAGGVLVSCRLRGGESGRWRLEIWDTGVGIAEVDRERVFEEFYQVGNPERDRAGGLGLGLSIVRRLTDLLELDLQLDSVPGRGTRFALGLPCTADPVPVFAAAELHGTIKRLAVAVVDDDPEVRDSMQLLLERWGCRVYAGADADEVLQRIDASAPGGLDAIVADYRLRRGRTGIDAIQTLRTAHGGTVPALIVSGDSSPKQLALMQESGLDCLSKPVPAARLHRWLLDAVIMARQKRDAPELPESRATQGVQ
jgi:signal transduction histidine kinase/FixJ family two-component response regulator